MLGATNIFQSDSGTFTSLVLTQRGACVSQKLGGEILKSGCLQSYLEDGDGTDGDQDDDPDVHFGGQPSAVVGIVVLIVFLRMVQHVVIVPPSVLILHTQAAGHFCCL